MTLNRIQNEAHAIQEIWKSFLFWCHRPSSQAWLFFKFLELLTSNFYLSFRSSEDEKKDRKTTNKIIENCEVFSSVNFVLNVRGIIIWIDSVYLWVYEFNLIKFLVFDLISFLWVKIWVKWVKNKKDHSKKLLRKACIMNKTIITKTKWHPGWYLKAP